MTREGWDSREREAEKAWAIVDEETEKLLKSLAGTPMGNQKKETPLDGLEILRQEALRASGGDADQATKMILDRLRESGGTGLDYSRQQNTGKDQ